MAARKREFVSRIKNSLNERILKRFPSFSSPNASRLSVGVIVVGVGCAGCLAWCVQQPTEEKHALPFTSLRHFGESKTKRGIFYDVVKCETTKGTSDGSAVKSTNYVSNKCLTTCEHCGHKKHATPKSLALALEKAQRIVKQKKEECGSPGVAVAVSVDGRVVWREGFGYSDVENSVQCTPDTVMRIASISKPLTATAVAKLWEQKKLDLDAPVQRYVPSFPEKSHGGVAVTLTTRHLLSHLGGIRHYNSSPNSQKEKSSIENSQQTTASFEENKLSEKKNEDTNSDAKKHGPAKSGNEDGKQKSGEELSTESEEKKEKEEFQLREYFIKDHYKSVTEALSLFKDDPLKSEPGTKYLYTTFGWTLISAVVEGASKKYFLTYMKRLFKELGMENTMEELNGRIIYNRARHYQRDKAGRLVNAPYVDNSYKWAGGGFISTVGDLLRFGNAMLYASQVDDLQGKSDPSGAPNLLPGILQTSTVKEMWRVVPNTEGQDSDAGYGLGWAVQPDVQRFGCCRHAQEVITHTGGAIGASSILLIKPRKPTAQTLSETSTPRGQDPTTRDLSRDIHLPPRGIVVALLLNMGSVKLGKTALALAECFEGVEPQL